MASMGASRAPDTLPLSTALPGYTSLVVGLVEGHDGVALLELARPQRHNAFHEELWEEFPRAVRALEADSRTRVILLTAQGANFCAGIDVGYLQRNFLTFTGQIGDAAPSSSSPPAAPSPAGAAAAPQPPPPCPGQLRAAMRRNILSLQEAYSSLEGCRVPVLAAVHGLCIGGGVDLITACDMRVCDQGASFCVKEVDLAIAADLGTLQRLPSIVGHGAAMDLALTARTVDAQEALRLGLVSSVVPSGSGSGGRGPLLGAALRLAGALAAKPALALQGTKRALLHTRDHPRVADGLDYVATWNSAQLISADIMRAFSPRGGAAAAGRGQGQGGARSRL